MDESEVLKFEHQVRPMKLSEAIRIGAKIRPQGFHELFLDGRSCALGAAYEGATGRTDATMNRVAAIFPQLLAETGNCSLVTWEIAQRNDSGESRESIADWLQERGL